MFFKIIKYAEDSTSRNDYNDLFDQARVAMIVQK